MHYITILLLTLSCVYVLNHVRGKEFLFRITRLFCWKKYRHTGNPKSYILLHWRPRSIKLWDCVFCQATHISHAAAWLYGLYLGLDLVTTCYLVVLSTVTSGTIISLLFGFLEDVRSIADKGVVAENNNLPTPVNPDDVFLSEPNKKSSVLKSEIEKQRDMLRNRGYNVDVDPTGEKLLIRHVPPREHVWNKFVTGSIPEDLPSLQRIYDTVKQEAEQAECTRCDFNKMLAEQRESVLQIIDAYLTERSKDNTGE